MRIVFDQKRGKGQKNKNKGDGKSEYGWGSIGRRGGDALEKTNLLLNTFCNEH